jgi:hypothetical protein
MYTLWSFPEVRTSLTATGPTGFKSNNEIPETAENAKLEAKGIGNEHCKRHRPRAFQQKAYQSARRQSTGWQGNHQVFDKVNLGHGRK